MKRILYMLSLLLVLTGTASAQGFQSRTLSGTTCPGVGCLNIDVGSAGSMGIQISGTFSGTLTFEQSIDTTTFVTWAVYPNGSTTAVTTATAAGVWVGPTNGMRQIRVRFSSYTSGSATINVIGSSARLNIGGSGAVPAYPLVGPSFTGQMLGPTNTCPAPSYSATGQLTTGMAITAAPGVVTCVGGTAVTTLTASSLTAAVPISGTHNSGSIVGLTVETAAGTDLWQFNNSTGALTALGAFDIRLDNNSSVIWGTDTILGREGSNYSIQRNGATAQRQCVANRYTSGVNNELFCADWQTQANIALVGTRTAATGTQRELRLVSQASSAGDSYAALRVDIGAASNLRMGRYNSAGTQLSTGFTGSYIAAGEVTFTATAGSVNPFAITPTYNQTSGTAANTDLLINRTQTAVGSGAQYLWDAQVGGVSQGSLDNGGNLLTGNSITTRVFELLSSVSTTGGSATSVTSKIRAVTGIANNTATDVFTVTVPNASHMATIRVTLSGSLGAGGAIGAGEATGNISYDFAVTRTAGVAAAVGVSSAYGSSTAAVAGAATITISAAASAISGAVGATNTFTIQVTIARGSGSSTNHTCRATAEIINANASGITVS